MDPYHLRAYPRATLGAAAGRVGVATPAPTPTPGAPQTECCPPPCPACGGLECLCRPRFFPGQILTADDLNRLEQYLVEKNKLHNRYLHGWGVVCGLEVVCHPCPGYVTVHGGYALSPCGEDIIVCREEVVNVCDLIARCRPPAQPMDCVPPRPQEDPRCKEQVEEWILAVCYDEKPSRGITPLKGSSGAACCSRCACGGSSACGCGCHSETPGAAGGRKNGNGCRPAQPNPPPQCEPTLICEGYRFVACKAPPRDPVVGQDGSWVSAVAKDPLHAKIPGELGERFTACVSLFLERWTQFPQDADKQTLNTWCCQTKAALLDFFSQHGTTQCDLYARVQRIACPDPAADDNTFARQWQQAQNEITAIGGEYAHHCLCSALLPPCPDPVLSDCVPLATVKLRKTALGCEILSLCNWGPRRFVVTFPHLGYWLSPFNVLETLRHSLESLCCAERQPAPEPPPQDPAEPPPVGIFVPRMEGARRTMTRPTASPVSSLLSEALRSTAQPVTGQSLLLGALGARDAQGQPPVSALSLAHPLQALLLSQVVRPTLDAGDAPAGRRRGRLRHAWLRLGRLWPPHRRAHTPARLAGALRRPLQVRPRPGQGGQGPPGGGLASLRRGGDPQPAPRVRCVRHGGPDLPGAGDRPDRDRPAALP